MTDTRTIMACDEESSYDNQASDGETPCVHSINQRVQVRHSPFIDAFYLEHPVKIIINTGAENNMVRASWAKQVGATIKPSTQHTYQANGRTPLTVVGETRMLLSHDDIEFILENRQSRCRCPSGCPSYRSQ
jgi:hypothetical protein